LAYPVAIIRPLKHRRACRIPGILDPSHELENVPIGITKVKSAAPVPGVQLAIVQMSGIAAVGNSGRLNAPQNSIELSILDMECVVVAFEIVRLIEIEGERRVYLHRDSVRSRASKYSQHSRTHRRLDQAASRMARTVAVRRKKSDPRRSAGTGWLRCERRRRKFRSSSCPR
jgi:hypothetical protein